MFKISNSIDLFFNEVPEILREMILYMEKIFSVIKFIKSDKIKNKKIT